ncbi:hypothetical protein COCMIDRAFT_41775 [Bipolaris oryzae ATCC 44560]|uniref:N-acetyltransferase domain-containing protein n=1 Tax=Bipolaris oryzae ATCC 44560 TaxID=930090 RepID=W6YQL3_COCMI|nr:uncharacterized protein COCMIDRAFT_41775 [Bipolaris oryzae ATCC 44560]EUC39783.1 hypothetical protein COCMIDRAFT_41775 [Bipolaris oryzae ATCC 44560]
MNRLDKEHFDNQIYFRVARSDDSSRIAWLVQAAFQRLDIKWTGPDVELNRNFTVAPEDILTIIDNSNAAFLIATTESDFLIGGVAVIKRTKDLARLALLAVNPTHQAVGIGRRILEQAEYYAVNTWDTKTFGLNALSTRCLLIEWYEKRGYRRTGERLELSAARAVEGLTLSKDLHFVEVEKQP